MAVVRKWLTPLEIMAADRRVNPTTLEFERSPDGGTTWLPDPGSDPRHNDAYRLPAISTADPQCDAAARIVHAFQDTLVVFQNSVNAAQFATAFMSLALALTPVAGVLAGIALLLFDVFIDIGQSAIDAAFTETVWDDIHCIIYCNIGANGQVSAAQRDAIMDEISIIHPGTVYNTLVNLVNLFGEVLMSNSASEYDDTGDCEDCVCNDCPGETDWCFTLFSRESQSPPGFVALNDVWGVQGHRRQLPAAPLSWYWADDKLVRSGVEKATLIQISRTLHAGTYTRIDLSATLTFGSFTTDIREFSCKIGATTLFNLTSDFNDTYVWEGEIVLTSDATLKITGVFSYMNPGNSNGGCLLYDMTIGGSGTMPSFA